LLLRLKCSGTSDRLRDEKLEEKVFNEDPRAADLAGRNRAVLGHALQRLGMDLQDCGGFLEGEASHDSSSVEGKVGVGPFDVP